MACMKCGKETAGTQVFCEECLMLMEKHPIAPGTPVQLLPRPLNHEKAAPRKRERTPSQTIADLQKLIRWLTITIAVLSLLLCATAGFLLHTLEKQSSGSNIGRNYTTDTSIT